MGNDTESKEGRVTIKFIHIFFSSYNSDGLSLMDVAVLTNNTEMVKLLIQHGAREGTECKFLVSLLFIYRWRTFFLLFCWLLLFSFVRSGIRWQQGIAEFAFGSTAQRSRKTVGREESAVVQSGSSGFGQTRRTVETASAHFAQNEIGTRTAEWVQFNIVLLLSLWILILKMLSSSSSLYIDLIRFDSCNMIYFYL